MVPRKDQLEASLHEKKLIQDGRLKEKNPLDTSEDFSTLCEACRRGDLKTCQEIMMNGVNINARDQFDYTPLILASLCGHYEVVQFLLESGAVCERDTFQGERCLYNALNNRIRNLLLSYDYHKSANPLQPFASHITSLLTRDVPKTSDIVITSMDVSFNLHRFILSARSPYFSRMLSASSNITSWEIPSTLPLQAFSIAMRHIYLDEIPVDVSGGAGTGFSESQVFEGIDKISRQLEIRSLWDNMLESNDRRMMRQRKTEEVEMGQNQLHAWFRENVLRHKVSIDSARADNVRWDYNNAIFADVLLRADEPEDAEIPEGYSSDSHFDMGVMTSSPQNGISIEPTSRSSRCSSLNRPSRKCTLFPVHRAMLIRSEFFLTMFSSTFREGQPSAYLRIIPVHCTPEILEIVLTFLYAEKCDFPLEKAIDVLLAADVLLIEKLKIRAAVIISTLGNGSMGGSNVDPDFQTPAVEHEVINIYDVLRAGWLTRVPRLEEFAARYFAYRLETYIEEDEFAEVIQESAARIKGRQETDSIELLDEIRYYLSERFRLRFEDAGLEDLMNESESSSQEEDNASNTTTASTPSTIESEPVPPLLNGTGTVVRTLDGDMAGDEFAREASEYQMLLGKIDELLKRLELDA